MGNVLEMIQEDFPKAGPHFRRAVELNPGLANANREYGLYFMRMGRFEVADRFLHKAARLDPASAVAVRDLGWNDFCRGTYEQAKSHLKQAVSLVPDIPGGQGALTWVQAGQGRLKAVRRAVRADSSLWGLSTLGWAYAQAGHLDSTRAILESIQQAADDPYYEAMLYGWLGQPAKGVALLEQTESGLSWLKVHPIFDPLREQPAFQRLLERRGLDEPSVRRTMEKLDPYPPPLPSEEQQEVASGTVTS